MEKRARITTRDGRITDEGRRRIERELDLEEASIAGKKEGGVDRSKTARASRAWMSGRHFGGTLRDLGEPPHSL
jgi:hypothetical protein